MAKLLLGSKKIVEALALPFSVEQESWYLLGISAKVKSEKQRGEEKTDDEDLTVEIDNQSFDSPAAFSGGQLHNLEKTVYFILHLYSGNYTLKLIPDISAEITNVFLESLHIQDGQLLLPINKQAEDGDRRPWITFALVKLALTSFAITAIVHKRYRDSDDLKTIVDGEVKTHFREKTQKPPNSKPLEWFYRFWYFAGSILLGKRALSHFDVNLPKGLHYVELWADRMPKVEKVEFNFGQLPRYPTVNNPRWTEDFYDDTPQIILARAIFGEAEGASRQAKIAVGWTIKNRVLAQRKEEWGFTYHEVILKPNQYEAFVKRERLEKLIDPLGTNNDTIKQAWNDSYVIAGQVIASSIADPTKGATNFYSTPIERIPPWATEERFKIKIDNLYFYRL